MFGFTTQIAIESVIPGKPVVPACSLKNLPLVRGSFVLPVPFCWVPGGQSCFLLSLFQNPFHHTFGTPITAALH